MKPVLFVVCFTLGVTLMVFSGYLPDAASARSSEPGSASGFDGLAPDGSPATLTVTRRVISEHEESYLRPAYDAPAFAVPDADQAADPDPLRTDDSALAADAEQPAAPNPEQPVPDPGEAADDPAPRPAPDEPTVESEDAALTAFAGPERVIWSGWDELPLEGSASGGSGELFYRWRQTGGSKTLTIANDALAVTTASGLLADGGASWRAATYEFELTVNDARGAQAVDYVKYRVYSAPPLKIRPTPERFFEYRNGYQLAHFVSWVTNLETYEAQFEIASPTELTITKVAGDACEVTGEKLDRAFLYQVLVLGQVGQANSWVELLIDTEEQVPAIVQLGVHWESRRTDADGPVAP